MQKQELIQQITYLLGSIRDPQRSQTLSQLQVIMENSVQITQINGYKNLLVQIKPTVPHCHLVQQIGLCIHYKLMMELADFKKMKLKIKCFQNSHQQAQQVEKQVNDKERIAAALQNEEILKFITLLTSQN